MLSIARASSLRHIRIQLPNPESLGRSHRSTSIRFLSSFAVLEQRDGVLQGSSFSAITAAQKLGGSVTGFIAGSNVQSVAKDAAKVKGLEKIITIENSAYDKVHSHRPSRRSASHILMVYDRGFQKTTRLYSLKTSPGEGIHMFLQGIQRSVRI